MVLRILTIILFSALAVSAAELCMKCHEPHYTEMGSCTACHRGNPDTSRKNIAHDGLISGRFADFITNGKGINNGKDLTEKAACRRCHTLGETGNNASSNLDIEAKRKTGAFLLNKINEPNDYMPRFGFDNNDAEDIVRYILNSGEASNVEPESRPFVVFINSGDEGVFSKKCGGCHRLLTREKGGMGDGDTAPNLSGLFTEFYPDNTLPRHEKWDNETLLKWVKNPRLLDKGSMMPPLKLSDDEKKKLPGEF
ncbi:selenite/tellurite reduction operon c-type cytochrome lipoprotein ExtS [Limisalsivibrio acetivorans]|uniref:selenite/tellurite reduction operon c-type cytochrome lipoprotein ExtS n=1 Tax=Limisalsivibrio acetivorans TaxID=1304888 RepID=UPI0003B53D2E|nr:selenite/tellurite reduction operon c-type cytochrome lipoprotein ExtS [Limisalsivibrio acetivorans]